MSVHTTPDTGVSTNGETGGHRRKNGLKIKISERLKSDRIMA